MCNYIDTLFNTLDIIFDILLYVYQSFIHCGYKYSEHKTVFSEIYFALNFFKIFKI